MAQPPEPEPPPAVRKTRDNALTPAAEATIRRQQLDAQAGAWTNSERRERWAWRCVELQAQARRDPAGAIGTLTAEVAALAVAFARRNKPRIRVPAATRWVP